MLLKILIAKNSEILSSQEFEMNKFPIFMGRDSKNDVFLEDHFKVISRKHAQIIQRDNLFYLLDLGSQNFTYLNSQRLQPDEEILLHDSDKIKVGDYELEIQISQEEPAPNIGDTGEKTMVFAAPFEEELSSISENLKSIFQKFSEDNSQMKNEMLRFSLMQKFNNMDKNDVNKIFAEYFNERFLEKKFSNEIENKPNKSFDESPNQIWSQSDFSAQESKSAYSFSSHFSNITDVLLDSFTKLLLGCLQFKQEFFGVTMYQILPAENLNELKEYLFDPSISSEEEKKRLSLLKDESQKLLAHQVGLLEGYKISIIEGTKGLLQNLDPEGLAKEETTGEQKNSFLEKNKIFSFVRKAKAFDAVKKIYAKYFSDPYHIEKKFFRPAFMKGYQKRISSVKPHDEY